MAGSRTDVHQAHGGMAEAMSVVATSQGLTGEYRPSLPFLLSGDPLSPCSALGANAKTCKITEPPIDHCHRTNSEMAEK